MASSNGGQSGSQKPRGQWARPATWASNPQNPAADRANTDPTAASVTTATKATPTASSTPGASKNSNNARSAWRKGHDSMANKPFNKAAGTSQQNSAAKASQQRPARSNKANSVPATGMTSATATTATSVTTTITTTTTTTASTSTTATTTAAATTTTTTTSRSSSSSSSAASSSEHHGLSMLADADKARLKPGTFVSLPCALLPMDMPGATIALPVKMYDAKSQMLLFESPNLMKTDVTDFFLVNTCTCPLSIAQDAVGEASLRLPEDPAPDVGQDKVAQESKNRKEDAAKVNPKASRGAQYIFDKLNQQIPARWAADGQTILLFQGEIQLQHPYRPETIENQYIRNILKHSIATAPKSVNLPLQ